MKITPRQVHLDFHTSELIEHVGEHFSKEDFAAALKTGHISSITVFAKCHHSNFYYPTKIGRRHPHLKPGLDLLGEMIETCHAVGVKAPIYYTVGWSSQDAKAHPEWLTKNRQTGFPNNLNYDFSAKPEDPKPFVSWENLCINNPAYQQQVFAEVEEICQNYPVDGFFFDIMFNEDECVCDACLAGMKRKGVDWTDITQSKAYFIEERRSFCRRLNDLVHRYHPEAETFYNGCDMYMPQYHEFDSHFELEDNPQVWGGYDKMPVRAKYFSRKKKPYVAQSGKFHTSWGEYAGFKDPQALKYEVAAMLAYGARCSLGDQVHPSGKMDEQTYRNIGYAYEYVEKIEPYAYGAEETTRLGIFLSNRSETDQGLTRMLLEGHMDFEIVLEGEDLSRFDALIIGSETVLSPESAAKVLEHVKAGKGLLVMADGGISDPSFASALGLNFLGKSACDYDYVAVRKFPDFGVQTPFLFYDTAYRVRADGYQVLAAVREPFFNRTYGHYCSHQNTPYKLEDAAYPAVCKKENVVYVAHNLSKIYFEWGSRYHRDLFLHALKEVYADPVMQVENLMSCGRARFSHQADEHRYVLNLLYGAPSQRGQVAVLEDFPTVENVKVRLKTDRKIRRVFDPVSGEDQPFSQQNEVVRFSVGKFRMHKLLVLEY